MTTTTTNPAPSTVTFDEYAQWLAATAGDSITAYTRKQWGTLSGLHLHMMSRAVRNWQATK